jgi:hypothetical protein
MRISSLILCVIATLAGSPAVAWGDLGHKVTALIAYRHLTPAARAALDALLAADLDTLTPPDFASRATWADRYRTAHRETAPWHYINIEIDHPDLQSACYGLEAAQDCIVNKIDQFAAELGNPATPPAERLLALKFLIHFVGDVHQPLHAADHDDRGGNCIGVLTQTNAAPLNLHAYWDVEAVEALGTSAQQIADRLDAPFTEEMKNWTSTTPGNWAMESFEIARRDAYNLPSRPTCRAHGVVALSPEYQAAAQKDAAAQLQKAAIRMAGLLNRALGTNP